MIGGLVAAALATWAAAAVILRDRGALARGPYAHPDAAIAQIRALAARHPDVCRCEEIGRSREGRPLLALRLNAPHAAGPTPGASAPGAARERVAAHAASGTDARPPRLLVSAQIHAIELVAGRTALAVAQRLAEAGSASRAASRSDARDAELARLLARAEIVVVPLLNPDGAARVWRRDGFVRLRDARATAGGVDPNRNFPFAGGLAASGWNAAATRAGSAYYRGPHPLSEPECAALARLALRERFCAAVNVHSIGGVVYLPEPAGPDAARARHVLASFDGPFQSRQSLRRYTPVRHARARDVGQLDPFLLDALGTPSVTVEVTRPGLEMLRPWYATRLFWWANPPSPERWLANDVDAIAGVLGELLARSEGRPCEAAHPELAQCVPGDGGGDELAASRVSSAHAGPAARI